MLTNEMKELHFTQEELIEIHNSIHGSSTCIQFKKEYFPIVTGKSGCKRAIIKGE